MDHSTCGKKQLWSAQATAPAAATCNRSKPAVQVMFKDPTKCAVMGGQLAPKLIHQRGKLEWRGLNDVFVSGKALVAGIGSDFTRFTGG